MPKKKLIHFQENLLFPHLLQPSFQELMSGFPFRGNWHNNFFNHDYPIVLELGCGKGEYTIGLAELYPEKNFLGIDNKGARLWRGCKSVEEKKLTNAGFVRTLVDHVELLFGKHEVSEIWITFPDPQPKKEHRRLTSPVFLKKYHHILIPDGVIHLKTDDREFFQYTLDIIRKYHHRLLWSTDDLYQASITDDVTRVRTFYESRWLEIGRKIGYLRFQLNEQ